MRLDQLAARIECRLDGDGAIEVHGIATLDDAGPGDLTFLTNPRYARRVETTRAAAVIVATAFEGATAIPTLRSDNPYLAFAKALDLFHQPVRSEGGIHPTAVVHPTAQLGEDPAVGPCAVIEAGVRLGKHARIGAHVVIGAESEIGDDFTAHAHASVRERIHIGHRVVLQNGAVVGGDGFGYAIGEAGVPLKMPQAGTVILEDDVEIGANSTVDRATIGATRIRRGAKIDNLVMIAHGCDVGEACFVAAQAGLAGSVRLGKLVQLGGQVGVAGHIEIGDFARAAAQSGIPNDVPSGATVGGTPAVDVALWRRASAALARLPELLRRVRRIEKKLGIGDRR